MDVIQGSVFCRAWKNSILYLALSAFFDRILVNWARGSAVCRFFVRESPVGRGWDTSWFGRFVTFVANLVPNLLHWLYRKGTRLFQGSFLCRFGYAVGDQAAVLSSWVVLVILACPHEAWNNTYGLLAAVLLLFVFYLAGMRDAGVRVQTGLLGGAFWIYALTIVIGVLISYSKTDSLRYFLFHFMSLLIAAVIISSVKSRDQLYRLVGFAAFGVCVASLYGFWQKYDGIEINTSIVDLNTSGDTPGRVFSFFDNPNTFAQILVLLIPLCCALVLGSRSWRGKFWASVSVVLGFVSIMLTYSRSSWLGLAGAIFLFCFLVNRKSVVFLLLAGFAAIPFLPETILNRILTISNSSDSSISGRFPIYQAGLRVFRDNWLMGVGLGSEVSTGILQSGGYYHGAFRFAHYHNIFLQIMVERGLVGLLSFLGTLYLGLKEGLRSVSLPGCDRSVRYLIFGAAAGLFGELICGLADYIWHYPRAMMLFWFVFAILLAGAKLAARESAETL